MVLGVTGGIATGKSALSLFLLEYAGHRGLAVRLLSADAIARDLFAPGAPLALEALSLFGAEYSLPGESVPSIDREKLGRYVFSDSTARKKLEALLHPAIIAALMAASEANRRAEAFELLILEIPLLYEGGLEAICDKVIAAYCVEETQISRLLKRPGAFSREDALARIAAQIPAFEKARRADFVIDTDRSIEQSALDACAALDRILR